MTTPTDAIRAAIARIEGEFDHPALLPFGALRDTADDVKRILRAGLAAAEGPRVIRYRARHQDYWLARRGTEGGLGLGYSWSPSGRDAHRFASEAEAHEVIDLVLPAMPMGALLRLSVELAAGLPL